MTDEVIYYSDDKGVKTTNREAVFGKQSFDLGTINSVRILKNPSTIRRPIILIICGSLFLIVSVVEHNYIRFFFGAFFLIVGIYDFAAPAYMIKTRTTKGEYVPLSSRDKERIEQIVDAIESAIAYKRQSV